MPKRRYEILLPLKHNDGSPVGDEALHKTRRDLVNRFDGVTFEPQPIQGIWAHEGVEYEDSHTKAVVDVEDTAENREFFVEFKAVLLKRFNQIEIYIVSYLIDVL